MSENGHESIEIAEATIRSVENFVDPYSDEYIAQVLIDLGMNSEETALDRATKMPEADRVRLLKRHLFEP